MPNKKKSAYVLHDNTLAISLFSANSRLFTKADIKIANYISANLNHFLQMTISELASATSVSEITISRFCKKLNLPGLQSLKIVLAGTDNINTFDKNISNSDNCESISHKIFQNIADGLNNTLKLLNFKALDRSAQLICKASRLICFGYGNSATVCNDIVTRFVRLGISCEFSADPHQQATLSACSTKDTLVIAVSYTGSSVDLLNNLQIIKENGGKIILITSHTLSPASKIADEVLIGVGPEVKNNSEASVSRLIHMAINDVLYTKVSILKKETFEKNMSKMRKSIAKLKS